MLRRRFITTVAGGALFGLGDLAFLSKLPAVSAAEARWDPKRVTLRPEIEPLVRFLEDTPRERLLEEVAARIRRGLNYRELLAALLLAGVRSIEPRPVGFKFHAVLVIYSAHAASLASSDADRWLPVFWALDYFKDSQARNVREGNWQLGPVDEAHVPPAHKARQAFIEAMNNWDPAAADTAVTGLARSLPAQEIFELMSPFGARDYRDIGHKAIYVANGWRTLQYIGWPHAEPVLRSLAYALLHYQGENPARHEAAPDRAWKQSQALAPKVRSGWQNGRKDDAGATEWLQTLRRGSEADIAEGVVALLNRGVGPASLWDALFSGACELLMRNPGLVTLHAVTSTNALHYAYQTAADDKTRRLILLQNAAFLAHFRGAPQTKKAVQIDTLEPLTPHAGGAEALVEIFADLGRDRMTAARKTLAYLMENRPPKALIDAARRLVFLKGADSHDYKFSSAVLEDYDNISPAWRHRFLAASLFHLHSFGEPDNSLVKRIRVALGEDRGSRVGG